MCCRPRVYLVSQGAIPPAPARPLPSAPWSLRPPSVAPGASARPPPPPPAPRLSSAPRCVPIPAPTSAVAAPASQVTAADKPGRALHRAAPGGPLPATHTRRPLGRGACWRGGIGTSIPGKHEKRWRREAGRPTSTQPSTLCQAPSSPSARWTRTRQALRARATHTCPTAGCARPAGALAQPWEWVLEFPSVRAKARAWSRFA